MTGDAAFHLPLRWRAELVLSSVAINSLMLALPLATLQVYDRVLTHPNSGTLPMLGIGVGVAIVLEMILRLARAKVTTGIAQSYELYHSERLVAHALGSWVTPARAKHQGEYVQALGAISHMKDYAQQRLIALSVDLPYLLLFLALLGIIGGELVLVPLAAVALFGGLVFWWGQRLRRAVDARNVADEQRYGFILESLAGIHIIKSLGLEPRFIHRYRHLQWRAGKSGFAIAAIHHSLANAGALFAQLIVVLVVLRGAPLVMQGSITMGGLIACVLLSGRLIPPMQHALLCWIGRQEFINAQQQVARIESLPLQPMAPQAEEAAGLIQLDHVSFAYQPELPNVIQYASFTIQPGEIVALSGRESSGRTTLLKLIAGILAPTEGTLLIDYAAPSRMAPRQLATRVAYLAPEPVLLHGTIRQNITAFQPDMEGRALEIAQLIGLDQLASQLPQGLDTMLEGGQSETIPPGFQQRVAIARALLHKPKIILYDQADRSLDREGYHQLYRLFARLKGKATIILVADDRNLMRLCDRTIAISDGALHAADTGATRGAHLRLVKLAGAA